MSVTGSSVTVEDFMKQAAAHAEDGDYVGAIESYTRAIECDPTFARAYGNRGMVRSNLGDRRGAVEDWQKAAELFLAQRSMANYEMALSYLRKMQA